MIQMVQNIMKIVHIPILVNLSVVLVFVSYYGEENLLFFCVHLHYGPTQRAS